MTRLTAAAAGRPLRPWLVILLLLGLLPGLAAAQASSGAVTGVDGLLAEARSLQEAEPEAALERLERAWQLAEGVRQSEVGVPLVRALLGAGQRERAYELLSLPALLESADASRRSELLALRLEAGMALRRFDFVDLNQRQLEALGEAPEDVERVAGLWHAQARLLFFQGKPADSEAATRRGVAIVGDRTLPVRRILMEHLGITLAQQGRIPDAIEAMLASEQVARALGETPSPDFLGNFGALFIYAQDWPRAIDYLSRALAIYEADPGLHRKTVQTLSNLGVAYNGIGDLAGATRQFETALKLARTHDLPLGSALNNLAYALREQGRLQEALAMFEETLAVQRAESDAEGIAIAQKNLGETLVRLGQRERAAAYLDQAYRAFLEADIRPKRLELYPVLIENLEALGRSTEALQMMREFKALSDENINVESNERIAKLEAAIDLARKEQELVKSEADRLRQQAELEALAASQQRQRLLAAGLACGLAALALIALLLHRQVRFKTRANQLLEQKNREIQEQHARLAELSEAIRQASLRDALTGLPNRRFLEQHMRELGSAGTPPESQAGLLLMIDIDHFKRLNDSFGHLVGDQALIHVAHVLDRCRQAQDVVVRWGGEEFLWLAHGAGLDQAAALCRRVRQELALHPFEHGGRPLPITVSIGFAPRPLWPLEEADWTLSLRVADDALYLAKHSGRDRWVGFAPAAPGVPPKLPLGQGAVATALESTGHLIRIEESTAPAA